MFIRNLSEKPMRERTSGGGSAALVRHPVPSASALDEKESLWRLPGYGSLTMKILSSMAPLLIRYRNTGKGGVHAAFAEEEFRNKPCLKLPEVSCGG